MRGWQAMPNILAGASPSASTPGVIRIGRTGYATEGRIIRAFTISEEP